MRYAVIGAVLQFHAAKTCLEEHDFCCFSQILLARLLVLKNKFWLRGAAVRVPPQRVQ